MTEEFQSSLEEVGAEEEVCTRGSSVARSQGPGWISRRSAEAETGQHEAV